MSAPARENDEARTETRPRLSICCSSPEGRRRLERVAEEILARMPQELAARLARTVMVFALDGVRHAGFAQGIGGADDATGLLAEERVRQQAPPENLTIIVVRLDEQHRPPSDAQLLAHELGHVAEGHTTARLVAASGDEREAMERAADAFAAKYMPPW